MFRTLLLATAVAVTGLTAAPAHAALSIVGGDPGTIPVDRVNEGLAPLGFVPSLAGYFGAQVNAAAGDVLRFEFLGNEAAADNRFNYTGFAGFSFLSVPGTNFSAAGFDSAIRTAAGGTIPFNFSTSFGSGGSVINGFNPNEGTNPANSALNFFVSGGPPGATTASPARTTDVVYLWFDDRGANRSTGEPDDDNHDDMVVRISVVPEPASLALLGTALLGLGLSRRRRRA